MLLNGAMSLLIHLLPSTLLSFVDLLWLSLILLVVTSPLVPIFVSAGRYGKLREDGKDENEGNNKKNDDHIKIIQESSSSSSSLASLFLHPSLYVRTSTAFLVYYVASSIFNGILIFEYIQVYHNTRVQYTPLLNGLRYIATLFDHHVGVGVGVGSSSSYTLSIPTLVSNWSFEGHEFGTIRILLLQMILFQIHLIRRVYESLVISKFSSTSKQHGLVTIMAYVYYFLCVVTPVIDSPIFDSISSFDSDSNLYTLMRFVGIILFIGGSIMQYDSHRRLAALRTTPTTTTTMSRSTNQPPPPPPPRYSIPFGGLFTYVSTPHYLCEMIEYTGLWMISGGKFSQL